ncbi:hypothetical protein T06_12588 [Trichinella sp. T6]|nr:hypothetical protein T06_12588 [Trichinella sp. T6]
MAIWRAQASSKASDRRLLQSSFVDAQPAQRRKQPLPSVNVSARGLSDPIRAAICRDDDLVDEHHRRGWGHADGVGDVLYGTSSPPDGELVLPSLTCAGSSTTNLATGLVTSAVEVRSRAARATPSLPGRSSATTPRGHRPRGTLSSNIRTRSFGWGPSTWRLHFGRGTPPALPALSSPPGGTPIRIQVVNCGKIGIGPSRQQLERTEGYGTAWSLLHEGQGSSVETGLDLTQDGSELLLVQQRLP